MIDLIVEKISDIINNLLKFADPGKILENAIAYREGIIGIGNREFNLRGYDRVVILGFGKASYKMSTTLYKKILEYVDETYVIIDKRLKVDIQKGIKLYRGIHPIPDEYTSEYTQEILSNIGDLSERDLLITLISGGGSALFEQPYQHLKISDIAPVWEKLLMSGADISEINTVRRHLSNVKGGRLAEHIYKANILSLILSDVPGDRLHDIASGPTAPDPTYYEEAYNIVRKYGLPIRMRAVRLLREAMYGKYRETPKEGHPAFSNTYNYILANTGYVLDKLGEYLKSSGLKISIIDSNISMTVEDLSNYIVRIALESREKYDVLLLGGETYTKVLGGGLGGPNQELILNIYRKAMKEGLDIEAIAISTDGIDGNSPAMGGYIDTGEYEVDEMEIVEYLKNSDSYSLLKKYRLTIEGGLTGTNLGDIWLIGLK